MIFPGCAMRYDIRGVDRRERAFADRKEQLRNEGSIFQERTTGLAQAILHRSGGLMKN